MDNLVEFKDVSKTFFSEKGETIVLSHVSFSLKPHEIIAIIGPSGCGKSTLLNLVSGLIEPSEGQVTLNARMGYMFQTDHLFSWRTVKDNVLLGLEITHTKTKENVKYAIDLLEKYQLGEFLHHYPQELSGGMRQRVALIRTLVLKPEVLLLDEPFSALDYQTKLLVLDDVYRIIHEEKKSAIIVTHDISEAISFADRVIVLSSRPSSIQASIPIDLHLQEEKTPLKARKSKEFPAYFDKIYKELHHDET
ncbi:taurine-transporting ATPase [Coprobacillus sp. CAG:826]|nr:taurine-transporting ATPase [Coprobacillus sp. CAG:826]